MWYVWRNSDGCHRIYRMEAANLSDWNNPKLVTIEGLPDGEEPWHPDVAAANDGSLVMALCSFPRDLQENKMCIRDSCSRSISGSTPKNSGMKNIQAHNSNKMLPVIFCPFVHET